MTKSEKREYDKARYKANREAILKQKKSISKVRKKAYNDRYRAKKLGVPVCQVGNKNKSYMGETDEAKLKDMIQQNLFDLRRNIGNLILATDIDLCNLIDGVKSLQNRLAKEGINE